MKITTIIFLFTVLGVSVNALANDPKVCIETATTQTAMNQCARMEYEEADAELNQVYRIIKETYKDNMAFLDKLRKAQLAWIELRDADFDMKYPHGHFGSVYPLCAAKYKRQLTMQRVEYLKQWLVGAEEGDVCSGSKMLQQQFEVATAQTPSSKYAQDDVHMWADKALESFEMYCYRTLANYTQVERMASAMKLSPLPKELMLAGMPISSVSGKGYYIERNDKEGRAILLGFSRPDACSISAKNITYEDIKNRLHDNYKLMLQSHDDVGLQISDIYIPGGKSDDESEAFSLGLVIVTRPKYETGLDGFTIGFIPPKTVKERYQQ